MVTSRQAAYDLLFIVAPIVATGTLVRNRCHIGVQNASADNVATSNLLHMPSGQRVPIWSGEALERVDVIINGRYVSRDLDWKYSCTCRQLSQPLVPFSEVTPLGLPVLSITRHRPDDLGDCRGGACPIDASPEM